MAANEKVGIEIELMGGEEAYNLLRRIDGTIDSLNKKKKFKSLGGLNSAKSELEGYMNTIKKYKSQIDDLEKKANASKSAIAKWGKAFENSSAGQFAKKNIEAFETAKKEIAEAQAKIKQMGADMDSVTQKVRTFGQTFKSISSSVAHVGSAMQSFGNALTRITSPFRRLTSGLLMGAGYKALNMFTEGLSNSFERADTMKNYDRALKALGMDTKQTFKVFKEAKTAKDNLDEAVQGLPTGLDEIMAAQKVYAGATGEMVNSTKTAIAANNAVLASGMGAREQRFMQKYLVALSSGAELTTTQWQSMGRIAPLVMRAVSKELGYASDQYAQFTEDIQKGRVAGEDFLNAFQTVGISGKVARAARVQTESWSGLSSNIRIAVTRMGQNVIETLNGVFKKSTGRTLLQQLLGIDAKGNKMGDGIRDWINDISESAQKWIKANPERIIEFFNALKGIDFKGLLKGIAEGTGELLKLVEAFAKMTSGKDLSALGRWMVRLNMSGNILTALGGLLKGTRHIWGFFGALGAKALGKVGKIGIFGKIASLFGSKKSVQTAGEVGGAIGKAAPSLISGFKNIALISGILATPAVAGFVITEAVKRGMANFKEAVRTMGDIDWGDAKKLLKGIAIFEGASLAVGGLVGKFGVGAATYTGIGTTIVGVISAIALGFADLDMHLIKDGMANFRDALKYTNEAVTEANKIGDLGGIDGIVSKLSSVSDAFNQIKDVFEGKQGDKKDRGVIQAGMPKFSKGTAESLKNLADSVKSIQTVMDALNVLATTGININATSKVEQIRRTLESVTKALNGEDGKGALPIIGSDKVSSMENLGKAVGHMKTLVDNLNQLAVIGVNQNFLVKIQLIKNAIKQVESTFSTMMGNITGPANLSKNTNNLAKGIGGLRKMVGQINKLAGLDVNNGGLAAVVGQIKTALQELQGLSGLLELNIEVKLSPKFTSSVNTVVDTIKRAKERIKNLKSAVTFSIPVSVTFSLSTNLADVLARINRQKQTIQAAGSGTSVHYSSPIGPSPAESAMGGLIYRARGGSIPWKRRGTDTVPAMLTPGEFVQNKRAVSAFGINFMRKVNALDMKGAMDELMHRAGSMANINRSTSITNNYNNNQKVVINNNGGTGAGFTFKSASRFVGAF